MATSTRTSAPQDRGTTGWIIGTLVLVAVLQAGFASHGQLSRWHTFTDFYSRLAEAFHHGQTSLLVQPLPQLLSLADPYDPGSNAPYRLHDAVLFDGRYYLYWGPAPALLLAAIQSFVPVQPGDQWLTWLAMVGMVAATASILLLLRRDDDSLPVWLIVVGVLLQGLSSPVTMLLSRAAIYESSIACGQVFLFAGLLLALVARRAAGRCNWLLGATSLCWALAFCSRLSLLPAVLALCAMLALQHIRRLGGLSVWHRAATRLALLATPVTAAAAGLACYNHVRFGSWREFGLQFQLTDRRLHTADPGSSFALEHLAPNWMAYLFGPVELSSAVPWLTPNPGDWTMGEPVAGLLYTLPFLLLIALLLWPASNHGDTRWLVHALALMMTLSVLPVLFAVGDAQNRYAVDAVPALVLLATLGVWRGLRAFEAHRRRLACLTVCLALWSITAGISLGVYWVNYTAPFRATLYEWYPPDPAEISP